MADRQFGTVRGAAMNTVMITLEAITETEHGTEVDVIISGFVTPFKMKLGHTITLSFPPPIATVRTDWYDAMWGLPESEGQPHAGVSIPSQEQLVALVDRLEEELRLANVKIHELEKFRPAFNDMPPEVDPSGERQYAEADAARYRYIRGLNWYNFSSDSMDKVIDGMMKPLQK